jgi:hypothetical protein
MGRRTTGTHYQIIKKKRRNANSDGALIKCLRQRQDSFTVNP